MSVSLQDFEVVRPKYEECQENLLDWFAHIHTQSKNQLQNWNSSESSAFENELREKLFSLGVGENKIERRGFEFNDFNHRNFEEMEIYNLSDAPTGYGLGKRMALYDELTSNIFEKIYPENRLLPSHLIHVTCTGYVAPSPAQKLVSSRSSGSRSMVTHAYHMGCYGSIPSIRIGMGHYFVNGESSDIVHTELCSLHINPTNQSTDQLVIQSLFADGFIKYSVGKSGSSPGFKVLGIHEEVIGDSTSKMTWVCDEWGFKMSIAREVPLLIRKALEPYLAKLAKIAGVDREVLGKAHYAIHPGGPKIIQQIAQALDLSENEVEHSQGVLNDYGNMSSATLPHVWDRIVKDPDIKSGELVVSLAFGPGLTICGALFEKE